MIIRCGGQTVNVLFGGQHKMKAGRPVLAAIVTAAAAFSVMSAPSIAQDGPAIPPNTFMNAQTTDQFLAKDELIGVKVHGADEKIVGDIEDLILNDSNKVVGVIMGTGGFLGIAEKKVGVRLDALQYRSKDGRTIAILPEATQEVIKTLPEYARAKAKKSLLDRAMEKAKELTDKGSVTAKDAYEQAKEKAGPALEKAKKTAGEAYEKAKEAAGAAYEKAKEATKPKADAPAAE